MPSSTTRLRLVVLSAGVLVAALFPACDDGESRDRTDIILPGDTADSDAGVDTDEPDDTATPGDTVDPGDTDTATDTADLGDVDDTSDADADGTNDTTDTDSDTVITPTARERSCVTTLVFDGAQGASTVHLAGEFNGWTPDITPMTRDAQGQWTVDIDLAPGSYAFKYVVDGTYENTVPPDVYTQWDGDVENRSLRVGDCRRPLFETLDVGVDAAGTISGQIQMIRAEGGSAIDPASVVLTVGDAVVTPEIDPDTGVVSFSHTVGAYGKHSVRLTGADLDGNRAENETFYVPLWYEAEPFTWQDATLYLIFTDRFRDSDGVDHRIAGVEERANYLGGDFRGITQAIEEGYFESLGVNALWLSPIYDNPEIGYRDKRDVTKLMSGFHGYWPISLEPEPRYADIDEPDPAVRLHELVETAHEHGIRVLFDLALNHVHESHPYCQLGDDWCALTCQCGDAGCGWDPSERGLDCQFDTFLPDLSYRNHDIVERVIADTMDMARDYDIDGMRIDAARHMDHVIMRTLRMTLRDEIEAQGGAPYYLVGETFTDDRHQIMQYVSDHELHGQFDFAMRSAIRWVLGPGNGSFRDLDDAAAASESPEGYGDFVWWMSPFFGNHDIDRFATVIAGNDQGPWGDTVDTMAAGDDTTVDQWDLINRMSMAYAFLLTYKGIPLLYYGDEIGLAGSQDPDNRRMMFWDHNANQRELLGRVQTLGQARRDLPALRHGARRELWKDDTLYVYARGTGADAVIVALNKGGARTESVTIPADLGLEGRTLASYNSARELTVSGGASSVTLDPWEYAIFR